MMHDQDKTNTNIANSKATPLGWWEWQLKENRINFSNEELIYGQAPLIVDQIQSAYKHYAETKREMDKKIISLPLVEISLSSENETHMITIAGLQIDHWPDSIFGLMIEGLKDAHVDETLFYEAILEAIVNPLFYKDNHGLYKYCNQAFFDFLGLEKEDILGKSVYDAFSSEQADIYNQADNDLMTNKNRQVYETKVRTADGELKDVLFNKSVHIDSEGQVVGLVGLMYDISTRKRTERLVERQNLVKDVIIDLSQHIQDYDSEAELYNQVIEQFLNVFQNADSGTVLSVTDQKEFIIKSSSRYDANVIENFRIDMKRSFIWHHSQGNIKVPGIVNNVNQMAFKFDIPDRLMNETQDILRSNLYIPLIIEGKLQMIISLDSNRENAFTPMDLNIAQYIQEQILIIHKLFKLYQETIHLSRYDGLTGFMNRSYFEAIFEDRLQIAIRNNIPITVVIIDLDNLKHVNDTYGHLVGDHYIEQFTKLLSKRFRSSDQMARIGGDEFCCTFMNGDIETIKTKLESIREIYNEKPFGDEKTTFNGSFSYGIAIFPEDGLTTYDLMKKADFQMYIDKKNNKEET